jgi:hypothetical protein
MPLRRHRARHALGLALVLGALGVRGAHAQIPDDAVELLMDVRIERGPASLVWARLRSDGSVLLAAQQIFALAGVRVERSAPDSVFEAVLEPEGLRLLVRTTDGYYARGGERNGLPPGSAAWQGGVLFLEPSLLADILGVAATVNVAELSVGLRRAAHLPAVQRLVRARRRAQLQRGRDQPTSRPTAGLGRSPALLGGAVLDWHFTLAASEPAGPGGLVVEGTAGQFGLGIDLLGGSGIVLHDRRWSNGVPGTVHETNVSWTRAWPQNGWLRQVQVGEVLGTGHQPRLLEGATVTNAPYVRPAAFAVGTLAGALPPGWEVEFYRHGVLVGATTTGTGGRYGFDVPLIYGSNPVEIIAYGPTGEVFRSQRTFEIAFERLPQGQFEYGLGGGRCSQDPCQALGNLDLRWGATRRLTLRAGSDYFWRDTLPDRWYPYGSVVFQATRSLALFAEAVGHAQVGGRVSLAPSPDFQIGAGHTRFLRDSLVPLVGSAGVRDLTDGYVFFRPGLLAGRLFVRADAVRSVGPLARRHDGRLTASAQLNALRLDLTARVSRQGTGTTPATTATTLQAQLLYQMGRIWGPLRRTILRGGLELDPDTGVVRVSGSVARRMWESFYLELSGGWERGQSGFVSLGFKASLPSVRFTSQNRVDEFGGSGLQSAEGSLLLGRRGRALSFADGRSVGRAGVSGLAFLDRDGDGTLDPDEPPVPGVSLRVGPWLVETDDAGRYAVWDVVPFEALIIEVNPATTPDPQWTPAVPRYLLHPDPNRFVPVDIPFVQTVEVMGEVRQAPEGTPLSGVEVVLEPDDDSPPYTTRTFSDGAFYLMGIRPGVYRVTITPATRAAFDLEVEDLLIEVAAGQTSTVEGVVLWARRGER